MSNRKPLTKLKNIGIIVSIVISVIGAFLNILTYFGNKSDIKLKNHQTFQLLEETLTPKIEIEFRVIEDENSTNKLRSILIKNNGATLDSFNYKENSFIVIRVLFNTNDNEGSYSEGKIQFLKSINSDFGHRTESSSGDLGEIIHPFIADIYLTKDYMNRLTDDENIFIFQDFFENHNFINIRIEYDIFLSMKYKSKTLQITRCDYKHLNNYNNIIDFSSEEEFFDVYQQEYYASFEEPVISEETLICYVLNSLTDFK